MISAMIKSGGGGYSWDIRDPHVRISLTLTLGYPGEKLYAGYPGEKLYAAPCSVFLERKWLGCPAIGVGTSRDLVAEKGLLEKTRDQIVQKSSRSFRQGKKHKH